MEQTLNTKEKKEQTVWSVLLHNKERTDGDKSASPSCDSTSLCLTRCASKVNKSLWDNWPTKGPIITLPNPADVTSTVPEIIECQYGVSAIDGSALIAFGTVALKGYRFHYSDSHFEGKWFQVREDAIKAKAEAVAKLEGLREVVIKQKQIYDARVTAEAAQESLRKLKYQQGWNNVDQNLRSRVEHRSFSYLPSDLVGLRDWTLTTQKLIDEVMATLKAKVKPASADQVKNSLAALHAKFGKKR